MPKVPKFSWLWHRGQQDHINPSATSLLFPASSPTTGSFLPPQAQGWHGQSVAQKPGMQHPGVQTHGVMPKCPENSLALFHFPSVSSGWSSSIILPKWTQSTFAEIKSPRNCSPSHPNQGQAAAFLGVQTSSSDRGLPTRLLKIFLLPRFTHFHFNP